MSAITVSHNVHNVNSVSLPNRLTISEKAYPEIARKNGRITCQTVKDFLHKNGLISDLDYENPKLEYDVISTALYTAFKKGILSLNCTKQTGILNNTPIRMSTGLGGKMKKVWAFSTISLINRFCLARMKNPELVCYHCYVKKSLRIDAIMCYVQNFYVLTSAPIPSEWIPVINPKNAEKHPYIRLESMGDLACSVQAQNYLRIAYSNPDFNFALWTKNPATLAYAIDTMGKPENLSTVLSASKVGLAEFDHSKWEKYFDHIFRVVETQTEKDTAIYNNSSAYPCQCGPESCFHCHKCYDHDATEFEAVELLRK